jgi:hypothetical protein
MFQFTEETPQCTSTAPAWQVQRRLQALAAAGWDYDWIADHADLTRAEVAALTTGDAVTMSLDTVTAIFTLYDRVLSATEGGKLRACGPTPEAVAGGWVPPAGWDDIDDVTEGSAPRVAVDTELAETTRILTGALGGDRPAAEAAGISRGRISEIKNQAVTTTDATYATGIRAAVSRLTAEELAKGRDAVATYKRRRGMAA